MNEKDTIVKLQQEVIDGLKKELNVVRYCVNALVEESKKNKKIYRHNSRCYYVMGIGTGLILSSIYNYCIDKKIIKKLNDSEENQSNKNEDL